MPGTYDYGVDVQELIDGYSALYTGAVYDILEEMGLPHQVLDTAIRPVRDDMVVVGPAFTVKGIPDAAGDEGLRDHRIHMFNDMKATGVPLIDVRDTSFDDQAAHYGEMNATAGAASGVIGALVDGGSRDTKFLLERGFPIMCRYLTPVEAFGRWSYYRWQQEIALRGALTSIVKVRPGDFVMGDIDGAVVIPKEIVVEVLRRAEELVRVEDEAREAFRGADDPVAVYAKYRKL